MYENDETFIKEYFFKHFLALTTLATNPNNKIYHIKKALEDIELKEESEGWS